MWRQLASLCFQVGESPSPDVANNGRARREGFVIAPADHWAPHWVADHTCSGDSKVANAIATFCGFSSLEAIVRERRAFRAEQVARLGGRGARRASNAGPAVQTRWHGACVARSADFRNPSFRECRVQIPFTPASVVA